MSETERQLSLPLGEEPVAEKVPARGEAAPARKKEGFKRVTRDADVARSYSDNVAFGYAVARGLAEVLSRMEPGELAALKARVARSAEQGARPPRGRQGLTGRPQEG
jgi:hypothetical protein